MAVLITFPTKKQEPPKGLRGPGSKPWGAAISASFHGIPKQSAVALQQEICKEYTASSLAPAAKKSGMGWLGSRLYELRCSPNISHEVVHHPLIFIRRWRMYYLCILFIESTIFERELPNYLDDSDYAELQWYLIEHPEAGAVIPGSGGVRKLRWSWPGGGKRGGVRMI